MSTQTLDMDSLSFPTEGDDEDAGMQAKRQKAENKRKSKGGGFQTMGTFFLEAARRFPFSLTASRPSLTPPCCAPALLPPPY